MVDTIKQSIYREHLQEISFLHEHRKAALGAPEFSLADLHELEERLEAHLDGLGGGGSNDKPKCVLCDDDL